MPHLVRGIEGPVPQKPQISNVGRRPRPCHLVRTARLNPDQIPTGLTNFTGNSGLGRGHSYRNAVFQVLLNTPIFVNFLRAHFRRKELFGLQKCTIEKDCLACGMVGLVQWYWRPERTPEFRRELNTAAVSLWNLCIRTFWGHQSPSGQGVGPVDHSEEYHPESFLLYFLTTMQRQLEAIPSEYQTFLSLFTIHTVRKWKCAHKCTWTSEPEQWEQSLYLPMVVQDVTGRSTETSIASAINRGLEKRAKALNAGDARRNCHICGNIAIPHVNIVNFPEILFLIRDSEEVETTRPDIPYTEKLYMKYWTSDRSTSNEHHAIRLRAQGYDEASVLYASLSRDYKLVAGIGERVIDVNRSKSIAFARAPSEGIGEWWLMDDEQVHEIPGLEQLDRLQRRWDGRGTKIHQNVHPEVFVFRRIDDAGWDMNYQTHTTGAVGLYSGNVPEPQVQARDARARVINDIFTQRIGEGLLKFKISFTPADPRPEDSMPFSLELGYEYKGNHWRIDGKQLQGRLLPNRDEPLEDLRPTPLRGGIMDRYIHRQAGPTTAADTTSAFASTNHGASRPDDNGAMNSDPSQPAANPFANNSFSTNAESQRSPNDMEVDSRPHSHFAQRPEIRAYAEQMEKQSTKRALDEYLAQNGWQAQGGFKGSHKNNNNGNSRKKYRGTNNNNNNNNKPRNNNNDWQNNQNRGGGGRHGGNNNQRGGGGGRGGRGRGGGKGRGHGRRGRGN